MSTKKSNNFGNIGEGLELIKEQTSRSRASMRSLPESPSKHHKILTEDGNSIKEEDTFEEKNSNYYSLIKPFKIDT